MAELNCAGIREEPFYCSLLRVDESPLLQWESRQLISPNQSKESVEDNLTKLCLMGLPESV